MVSADADNGRGCVDSRSAVGESLPLMIDKAKTISRVPVESPC